MEYRRMKVQQVEIDATGKDAKKEGFQNEIG